LEVIEIFRRFVLQINHSRISQFTSEVESSVHQTNYLT
jgi:hypothetical protein